MNEKNEWKPIETAPKDGTVILGGLGHAVYMLYWWLDGYQNDNGLEGWIDGSSNRYEKNITYHPTHWMRLPDPPAK